MRLSGKSKVLKAVVFTLSAATLHLALPTSVKAEAPPGESYSPPPQATERAYNPPVQAIDNVQFSHQSSLAWLGLIGLAGLAGLVRRK